MEGVLAQANQNGLTGDNLVSVDGAEEDGVDNRVQAPARAPGEGTDGVAQGSDEAESPAAESSAAAAEPDAPSDQTDSGNGFAPPAATSPMGKPVVKGSASSTRPEAPAPPDWVPQPAQPSRTQSLNQPGPGFVPAGTQTAPLPAATVGNSSRGIAARLGSSFAALPKPKLQAKPKKSANSARQPGSGQGLPAPRTPGSGTGSRRALLSLERIEPWSVMKFSFLISLVGWVVLFVAVAVIYFALSKLGVFHKIETTVGLVTSSKSNPAGSNATSWFKASRVLGYTMLVGAVNVIVITALATVGAVLYNLVTSLSGGIEVTLKESD